ncbi:tRNA guanosine-2'-O-methyltransferase [Choiromyces venosus 120613-1]|uniref:tRNA (guanine(10)-N(2))-methyltransferase n=1 Tax=Choiromyces venosus 120613-1 TaxID=1336337 RepID=A0A3N4JMB5_9PEZI|nr:tRNA guanosine-2'-O-methyltransferase [Choiromyces venosus 120613-1]
MSQEPSQLREYLIYFAQIHETFRKAELDSLSQLTGVEIQWKEYSDDSPFAIVHLPNNTSAKALVERSILTKGIYELWSTGPDYDHLHAATKSQTRHLWPSCMSRSFKFEVECYNGKRKQSVQREIIEGFAYLGLDGAIKMRDPDTTFTVLEEFPEKAATTPTRIFFGRRVGGGSRGLVEKYDLKKRHYIGTTSMDAELALVTVNMALVAPGKIAFDPFVGTGSFVVSCAHFGGMCLGSDIDGRQIRGKQGRGVLSNFQQYGLVGSYLDGFVSDLTNTPIRRTAFIDAIVCDPPYGVREGLKVLGSRDPEKLKQPVIRDGVLRHLQDDYVPPKRPYSFLAMLDDILQFAADHLVPGGRLCFWMPTANEDFSQLDIPTHPQLELVSVCVQEFNKWSRRLITYTRTQNTTHPLPTREREGRNDSKKATADELNSFRKKYFEGFRSGGAAV